MHNKRDHSNPTFEESLIYPEVRFLINFLEAPANLYNFDKVLPDFRKTIPLFLPIADYNALATIEKLQQIFRNIDDKTLDIWPYVIKTRIKQKSVNGYYGSNPHYSTYWHRPKTEDIEYSYQALKASLLPVWIRLQQSRLNKHDPFYAIAYDFGLAVRQLGSSKGRERSVLLELPLEACPPTELLKRLTVLSEKYSLDTKINGQHKSIVHLRRVLSWYEDDDWNRNKRNIFAKTQTIVGGRRKSEHGAVETETQQRIALIDIGEPTEIQLAKYLPKPRKGNFNEEEAFDKHLVRDIAPHAITLELNLQKQANYFLENRTRIARKNGSYAAQAIEMRNQYLPVGKSKPTAYELGRFIDALNDLTSAIWLQIPTHSSKRAAIAAWAACRFFLSRPEEEIRRFTISPSVPEEVKEIVWVPDRNRLFLPTDHPKHEAPNEDIVGKLTVLIHDYFSIAPSRTLEYCLKRMKQTPGRLFDKSYEAHFAQLIAELNRTFDIKLTPSGITSVIHMTMSHLAPADVVIGQYFLGKPPNQYVPAVYSVVPEHRLQALYIQACDQFERSHGNEAEPKKAPGFPLLISDDDWHVGSMHVPRPAAIRSTVKSVTEKLEAFVKQPITGWVAAHNLYTAYVVFFLLSTTGVRLVSALLPAIFDIDEETGYCFVSDKDDGKYCNARVIWLHERLMSQLKAYLAHTTRVRQHLALAAPDQIESINRRDEIDLLSRRIPPNRELDLQTLSDVAPTLFMFDHSGTKILNILPSLLTEYIGSAWKLRVTSLRHHIRSHFLRSGLSGELIDALLGHAERGQEPWGPYSTLPPTHWRRHLSGVLDPMLDELALKVMHSPLIGRLQ